jgi:cardiolipin synthase
VVILVVSRDILIVGGVLLSKMMNQSLKVQPLFLSKLNTATQIALAGIVLALLGFDLERNGIVLFGSALVAALTIASGAQYVLQWIRHMASSPEPPKSR